MSQSLQWIAPDGTTINFTTDGSSDYKFLKAYDGFSMIPTSHITIRSPYLDGSAVQDTRIEERNVSFRIMIVADDLPELESNILALTRSLNPKLGTGVLVFTQDGGSIYALACRGNNTPSLSTTSRGRTWQEASIDLIAFNPFWYDPDPTVATLATLTGGFTFPLTSPFTFGTASPAITLNNPGDVSTPVTIAFYGDITNPSISFTAIVGGVSVTKTITATLTMSAGDSFIITTGPGSPTVRYLHGTSDDNGFEYISDASVLTLQIQPGDNVIDFSASAAIGADAYCGISFYPQYSGV
jgi:hypothetical protein